VLEQARPAYKKPSWPWQSTSHDSSRNGHADVAFEDNRVKATDEMFEWFKRGLSRVLFDLVPRFVLVASGTIWLSDLKEGYFGGVERESGVPVTQLDSRPLPIRYGCWAF